ncbi:MAG: choloylglycine hydrolase [Sphingobium sp.]|nr:MAG: choloylglycine hydrolase [Sphingobium sp.]
MSRLPAFLSGLALLTAQLPSVSADACTRLVYHGANDDVITARSMDWKVDVGTNLWIFPRGIARSGEAGPNSVKWTSRYGSVIATGYDISTTDGMNEAGLTANLLWLVESEYPHFDGKQPGMSIAIWTQYVLDNFATVKAAVDELSKESFVVVTDNIPGEERLGTLHLAISDASGDSAIFEYIKGKLVIHHGPQYPTMLPGTNRSADRFARASFYVKAIPKSEDPVTALASVFSVIRNVSVPLGISTPDQPNISSTRWRTVADHKRKLYFFESAMTPNSFWVDLKTIDFAPSAKVRKLDLGPNQTKTYSGEVSGQFKDAPAFKFLGLS